MRGPAATLLQRRLSRRNCLVQVHLCELLAMVEHVLNLQFLKYTEWRKKPRSFDMTAQTTVLQNYQYIFISR